MGPGAWLAPSRPRNTSDNCVPGSVGGHSRSEPDALEVEELGQLRRFFIHVITFGA